MLVEFEAFHDNAHAGAQAARWLCKLFGASKIAGVARVLYPHLAMCTWSPSSRMPSIIGKQRLGMDTTTTAGMKIMVTIPWLLVYLLACNNSNSKRSQADKMKTQDRAFHILTILSNIGSGSSDCLQPSAEV